MAAGTNNALREVGSVFGVAILSAVFAAHGGYASFIDGFRAAEWVASAVAIAGCGWAVLLGASEPAAPPGTALLLE